MIDNDDESPPRGPTPVPRTHRQLYPEQYTHHLCGMRVQVADAVDGAGNPVVGTVERVFPTRYGLLATLQEYGWETAWLAANCHPIGPDTLNGAAVFLATIIEEPDDHPHYVREFQTSRGWRRPIFHRTSRIGAGATTRRPAGAATRGDASSTCFTQTNVTAESE